MTKALASAPICANGAQLLVIALTDTDAKDAKQLFQKVATIANTISLIVNVQKERISYMLAVTPGTPGNCQQYIKLVNDCFGGRGGGKPDSAQGGSPYCADWEAKLASVKEQILAMW